MAIYAPEKSLMIGITLKYCIGLDLLVKKPDLLFLANFYCFCDNYSIFESFIKEIV